MMLLLSAVRRFNPAAPAIEPGLKFDGKMNPFWMFPVASAAGKSKTVIRPLTSDGYPKNSCRTPTLNVSLGVTFQSSATNQLQSVIR